MEPVEPAPLPLPWNKDRVRLAIKWRDWIWTQEWEHVTASRVLLDSALSLHAHQQRCEGRFRQRALLALLFNFAFTTGLGIVLATYPQAAPAIVSWILFAMAGCCWWRSTRMRVWPQEVSATEHLLRGPDSSPISTIEIWRMADVYRCYIEADEALNCFERDVRWAEWATLAAVLSLPISFLLAMAGLLS